MVIELKQRGISIKGTLRYVSIDLAKLVTPIQ